MNFTARPNLKSELVLTPKGSFSAKKLAEITLVSGKPIKLEILDPAKRETKAVVLKYPELPLEPLLKLPSVLLAERCSVKSDQEKTHTRQVLITHLGPPPPYLDLGNWGDSR